MARTQPGHSARAYHGAMAEIRKYDPSIGNAITQALRAAMGDPIRPVTTWQEPAGGAPEHPGEPEATTTWVSLKVTDPEPAQDQPPTQD